MPDPADLESRDRIDATRPVAPKPAVEARQGVISGRVVTVLAVSLSAAIIAMIAVFIFSG